MSDTTPHEATVQDVYDLITSDDEYTIALPELRPEQLLRLSGVIAVWDEVVDTLPEDRLGVFITEIAGWVLWGTGYATGGTKK